MSAILNLLRLKPGQWMNVDTIKKEANARAKQCTERWDIPQTVTLELKGKATDVPVDADLLNKRPLLFGTRNGGRLSGYMLEEDPTTGFNSPATPLLFSILPVLAIVMASTGLLLGTVGTALGLIPFLLVAWTILDVAGAAWALGALTIGLGGVFSTISNGMGIPALLQGGASYSSIFLPILLLLPALFLFNRGLKTGLRRLAILLAAIFATMIACHFLPIPLVVLLWSLALGPAYSWQVLRQRALELESQSMAYQMETTDNRYTRHAGALRVQAEAAARDNSGWIGLGVSTGRFAQNAVAFSPDAGMLFGLSAQDLSTNLFVSGQIGFGKTTLLRAILFQYIRAALGGGTVIFDGAKALAMEMVPTYRAAGVPYTLIHPSECPRLAVFQGLSASDVVAGFLDIFSKSGGDGKDAFWTNQGEIMLWHTATLLSHITQAEKKAVDTFVERIKTGKLTLNEQEQIADFQSKVAAGNDEELMARVKRFNDAIGPHLYSDAILAMNLRSWFWSPRDLHEMLKQIQPEKNEVTESTARLIDYVRSAYAVDMPSILEQAIDYIERELPIQANETRSSIYANVIGWITPLMHNDKDPTFVAWASCEEGAQISQCFRGEGVGVSLPRQTYGTAGQVCQALLKRRVQNEILKRADDIDPETSEPRWKERGERHVLIVVDECHGLIGKNDAEFLPVARSLGGQCLYATQNIEQVYTRLGGRDAAHAVLDNFLSVVSFSSSTSTKGWIRNLLGYVSKLRFMGRSGAVNFRGSWSSLAQSVYGDPDHEFAAFFRRRRRAGAGRFAGAHNDKREGRAIHKHDGEIVDFQSMNQAEWSQPEPLFTQSDEATLAQKGMAVAQVQRAGVKRHEIIEAAQMYSNGQSNDVFKRVVGAVRHPWVEAQTG